MSSVASLNLIFEFSLLYGIGKRNSMSSVASLNFPFRFLFSYGTGRGILIFCFPITHNEKRICILFFVVVWHSMQNGFNLALLFFR